VRSSAKHGVTSFLGETWYGTRHDKKERALCSLPQDLHGKESFYNPNSTDVRKKKERRGETKKPFSFTTTPPPLYDYTIRRERGKVEKLSRAFFFQHPPPNLLLSGTYNRLRGEKKGEKEGKTLDFCPFFYTATYISSPYNRPPPPPPPPGGGGEKKERGEKKGRKRENV